MAFQDILEELKYMDDVVRVEEYISKDIDFNAELTIKAFSDIIIKNRQKDVFSILFATDLHYKSDNEFTFGTMKKLREMVICAKIVKPDLFVLNGDLTDGHSDKSIILSELAELFDILKELEIPIIIDKGNHDSATWFAFENNLAKYITSVEWNEVISKVTKRNECGYGYLDFKKHKIRAIYMNTSDTINETDEIGRITRKERCQQWYLGIGWEQINWLNNVLSDCPQDYSVIFFSHYIPYGKNVENGERVWKIIKDFNKENKVLVYMYGHKHKDFTEKRDGITCICTKDMMNAQVITDDGTEYCATLKDIPVICKEAVLNNPNAQILGGWDYVEITENDFTSKRFLLPKLDRNISLKK